MKSDIIDVIVAIIIVLMTVSVLSYIILKYFVNNSTYYYCKSELINGIISPKCLKYYEFSNFVNISGDYNTTIQDITGYILNCYEKYYQTNLSLVICYSIKLYSPSINVTDLINYIGNYTNFNPQLVIPAGIVNETGLIENNTVLFIIYNNSYIYLWQ